MNNVLKMYFFGVVGFFVFLMFLSNITYINPGNAGVWIDRSKGVDPVALTPGLHFTVPFVSDIVEQPVHMQSLSFECGGTEIRVTSVESQAMEVCGSIAYEVVPDMLPKIYSTFYADIDQIANTFMRKVVNQTFQDVIGAREISNLLGPGREAAAKMVENVLSTRLIEYGFVVKQVTVSDLVPPKSFRAAIEAKNAMEQQAARARNELDKKTAEAQQLVIQAKAEAEQALIAARAEADAKVTRATAESRANRMVSESLTPILIEYNRVKNWDGKLPQVTGGTVPFINVK